MADALGVRTVRIERVLEGGSIDVNGAGAVLTTEQCLLNPNRNPQLTRARHRSDARALSRRTPDVLWLGDGIVGDDTDGHIDDLTRFVDETTLVTVVEPNRRDANHAALAENRKRLDGLRLSDGRALSVVELPMPSPLIHGDAVVCRRAMRTSTSATAWCFVAGIRCAAGCAGDRRAARTVSVRGASCRSIVARWSSVSARCIV